MLFVISRIFGSISNPALSWTRLYIFMAFTQPASQLKLVNGPWLFLQYDLIIIALSSISWAFILILRLSSVHRTWGTSKLVPLFLVGTVILGSGATVALSLCCREGKLLDIQVLQEISVSSGQWLQKSR